MNVAGKVAIVTGGASGLGKATANALVAKGAKVCVCDLDESACLALVDELGADNCTYAIVNVTEEASVSAGLDAAVETYGELHIVVNSAGIGPPTKTLDRDGNPLPLAKFKQVVDINLNGTFNVLSKAAAIMARQTPFDDDGSRGVIINVASVAAFDGRIGQAGYSASKAGVVGMTLPIARELARYGIRINAIAPGVFRTEMVDKAVEQGGSEEVIKAMTAAIEFPKRMGHPAEFAQLVMQMIENDYINGEVVRLDGGIRLTAK
jgi:NAD(P)-dependent dehydrogenase (short-subunit alcohol dehydrogenase family)